MKRKKRNRQSGWILPYLHIIGETFGAVEEPETRAVFELGRLAWKAFNRIKDRNYEALYEAKGSTFKTCMRKPIAKDLKRD